MVQLNLLPDVKKEFLRAQSMRRKTIAISILVSIVAAGLTAVVVLYVYVIQNGLMYLQTQDIKSKSSKLSSVQDIDKYLTIQNQLAELTTLHDGKNNFSRLVDFLPRLNPAPPQNINLSNLDVDSSENTIVFKGRVKDYGALTTFKDTLKNASYTYTTDGKSSDSKPLFTEVTVDSALYEKTTTASGVTFSVTVKYDPDVFKQQNTGVVVTVPNKETTGSVVGTPSIFGGNQ